MRPCVGWATQQIPKRSARSCVPKASFLVSLNRNGVAPPSVGPNAAALPDLVGHDVTAERPATKLVGDITAIDTWEGWLYLATVLDCFSKKVVGYAMADHMRTSVVTSALGMAARNGHTQPGITICPFRPRITIHLTRIRGIHQSARRLPDR